MIIDFDKIDQKKVSILCKHPESIKALVDFLKTKKFEIHFEKTPGAFFQSITTIQPGFVMISNEMNASMGKVFPHFIQKKFKIPVLLFPEGPKATEPVSGRQHNTPAIRSLESNAPDKILENLEGFRGDYEKSLSGLGKSDKNPSYDQLRAERIKRQEEVLSKLSEKIKTGAPLLGQKNQLDLLSVKIADPSGHGSFFFFTELPAGVSLQEFQERLREDLSVAGDQRLQMEPLEGKVSQEIYHKFMANSDHVLHGMWGDQPVSVFYFVDADSQFHDSISLVEEGYLVAVEDWWARVPLNFNVNIWLQRNGKKLLYVKRGQPFPEYSIERFVAAEFKILIDAKEFHQFQQISEIAMLANRVVINAAA